MAGESITIAALYVQTDGCYFGLPDVDPWDEPRDARLYDGPYPVVAHPPCQRWGRYWAGSPYAVARGKRLKKGDDGGCFAATLESLRRWGGGSRASRRQRSVGHLWPQQAAAVGRLGRG